MTDPATLRALAEAATPGPWQDANGYVIADGRVLTLTPNNRAYIAAADPQTVLALLDRSERAEAERDQAMELLRRATDAAENGTEQWADWQGRAQRAEAVVAAAKAWLRQERRKISSATELALAAAVDAWTEAQRP